MAGENTQKKEKRLPYVQAETAIIESPALSKEEIIFYIALKSFRNRKNGNCFPSMRKVAKRSKINIDTAYRAREKLKNIGLISWPETKGGRKHKCHYTFTLESDTEQEIARVLRLLEGGKLSQTKDCSNNEKQLLPNTAGNMETEPTKVNRKVKELPQERDSLTIPAERQISIPEKGLKVSHKRESNQLSITNRSLNNTKSDADLSKSPNVSYGLNGEVNLDLPEGGVLQNQPNFSPADIEEITGGLFRSELNITSETILEKELPLDEVKKQLAYWPYRNQSRMDNPEGYFLTAVLDKYPPPKNFPREGINKWKRPLDSAEMRQLNRKLGKDKTADQKRLEERRKTTVISPEVRAVFLAELKNREWEERGGRFIIDDFYVSVDQNSWRLCYSDDQPIGEGIIEENSFKVIENQLSRFY